MLEAVISHTEAEETVRVLLIEDDEDDYRLTRAMFSEISEQRFQLDWVKSYDAGLKAAARNYHHVALVDYRLGGRDGLELIREAQQRGYHVPMILLTGQGDHDLDMEAMWSGAADYIVKGQVNADTLERSIRYAVERARAFERLRESEERYRDLFDNATDLIQAVGPKGRLLYVNRAWRETLGYDEREVEHLSAFDILHPDFREHCDSVWKRIEAGEFVGPFETRLVTRSGKAVDVEGQVNSRFTRGQLVSTRCIFRDITERKLREAKRERRARQESLNADVNIAFSIRSLSLRESLQGCVEAMVIHLDAFFARIWMLNKKEQVLELLASAGAYTHTDGAHARVPVGQYKIGIIAQERRPHLTNDVQHDPRVSDQEWARREGIVAFAGYPLVANEKLVGVLAFFSRNELAEDTLDALAVAANTIAHSIERHTATERLSELTAALENAVDGIARVDAEHRFTHVNRAYAEMCGYVPEEMIGLDANTVVHEDDIEGLRDAYEMMCAEGKSEVELRSIRKDGSVYYKHCVLVAVHDRQNNFAGHFQFAKDVTERKLAETALHEADRRALREYEALLDRIATLAQSLGTARSLHTIYDALKDFALVSIPCSGIFISLLDEQERCRRAVYAFTEGEEVDISELPPMPLNDSPHSRAVLTGKVIITDDFQSAMKGLPIINIGVDRNPDLPRSSLVVPMSVMGRTIGAAEVQSTRPAVFTQEHATALRMAANLAANAIENVQLMERERESAEQLRQSQKLEAVGQLAGGVAHDFNNLLTAINGYSDLTLRRLREEDPLRTFVEEIRKSAGRAASLTRQLLAFSRKQVLQPRVLRLNDSVSEVRNMLARLIGENIELVVALDEAAAHVKADPGQIEQVLMNLVVNARDAMPGGGKIIIETQNVTLDHEYARRHTTIAPGRYVMLAVSDNGCGMDAETQKRIFEPFFTTKETGKGTGLGLSTVYGIVKQSGGNIWVYSEPGVGSTFKVYLPRVDEEATQEKEAIPFAGVPRGSKTVMLVEDDQTVRQVTAEMLELFGYEVLATEDCHAALALAEDHAKRIDLLLTDIVMPQMSGRELARRVEAIRPDTKVLFMSGYTEIAIAQHGVLAEGSGFIQKPFSPESLSHKVREVLEAVA